MTEPAENSDSSDDGESKLAADLQAARKVLQLEAEAINQMAAGLGAELSAAVDLLIAVKGMTVISGMGKSGHIGNKIAATLASTGTPAHSIHPGEASHGDLGMVRPGDAVIAMSNSGETDELRDLVSFTRLQRIPLIAMVGREDSSLGNAADVALVLPPAPEACPLGLAPTTSSTMMLALGDALAVALMERRGFGPNDYHALHPGGRLGRKFLKVGDVMHSGDELPLVGPEKLMSEAILVMTEKGFGCVGVIDDNDHLSGIITDGDLRRAMAPDLLQKTVAEVMSEGPLIISRDELAAEALGTMEEAPKKTSLFVAEAGKPIGLVHIHDILSAGIA